MSDDGMRMSSGLTASEERLRAAMVRAGHRVLRNGWPDFLVTDKSGCVLGAVEAKTGSDRLSVEQQSMIAALASVGIMTEVVRVDRAHLSGGPRERYQVKCESPAVAVLRLSAVAEKLRAEIADLEAQKLEREADLEDLQYDVDAAWEETSAEWLRAFFDDLPAEEARAIALGIRGRAWREGHP
jgi:hypothetical protein